MKLTSFRDIARALGLSQGTVHRTYWQALAKLGIEPPPGINMGGYTQRACRRCGEVGHYARTCR